MALNVLIVDDSPAMRHFIRRAMAGSGIELDRCEEAGNGEEALARLRENLVDLVLTDINMPSMNGEELLECMDADERLRRIPTLVISTDATRLRVQRMLSLGAQGYLSKPFSPEALRAEVERVLQVSL